MLNQKRLNSNLELWASTHPKQAHLLPYADFSGASFVKTPNGALNIRTEQGLLYADSPEEEAKKWAEALPLKDIGALFVFGLGSGAYYLVLKNWLEEKKERSLIFLEDDLRILKLFFETELAEEILKNPQIQISYLPDIKDEDRVLDNLYWSTLMAKIQVDGLESYKKQKKLFFEELQYKIAYDAAIRNALLDEYLRFGASFFRNFYPNMLNLYQSSWGNSLFGKFQNIPAIICGAGPSLEKHFKLLEELKEKALIFTGGSSLNAISAHGIQPHFGAGIDPNPAQLLRIAAQKAADVPFFYRNRIHSEAFQAIKGPKLYISGAGGYDVAEWFEKKFGLESEFLDEGHNVINFCLEVAARLGCNPIILIGMDLAFTGMKSYASGVIQEAKVLEEDLQEGEERPIVRTDIYGKPVYTLWKWIAEADYIGNFAKAHKEITLINATEGGIGFPHLPNEPLKEVVGRILHKKFPLQELVQKAIQESAIPQVTKEKLREAALELKESLKRSLSALEVLIEETTKLKQLKKLKEPLPVTGLLALSETELSEEPAYHHILDIFNVVYAHVLNRRFTQINKKKGMAFLKQKLDLQIEKYKFLHNVAEANLLLLDHALSQTQSSASSTTNDL